MSKIRECKSLCKYNKYIGLTDSEYDAYLKFFKTNLQNLENSYGNLKDKSSIEFCFGTKS